MSVVEWRGGFPVVFVGSAATSGEVTDSRGGVIPAGTPIRLGAHQIQQEEDGRRGPITSKWMRIANHDGANDLRVYFSQDHFDDDSHYLTLDSEVGLGMHTLFEGPVEAREVWVRGVGAAATFEITAFHRRG
jgi:hypothetical protein